MRPPATRAEKAPTEAPAQEFGHAREQHGTPRDPEAATTPTARVAAGDAPNSRATAPRADLPAASGKMSIRRTPRPFRDSDEEQNAMTIVVVPTRVASNAEINGSPNQQRAPVGELAPMRSGTQPSQETPPLNTTPSPSGVENLRDQAHVHRTGTKHLHPRHRTTGHLHPRPARRPRAGHLRPDRSSK